MKRLDPQYRLLFGEGGRLDASPNVERMEAEIAKLSPDDARGFVPSMRIERPFAFCFHLGTPFHGVRDLLQKDIFRALPLLRPWRSLHSEVGRFFDDPRLKLAFTGRFSASSRVSAIRTAQAVRSTLGNQMTGGFARCLFRFKYPNGEK